LPKKEKNYEIKSGEKRVASVHVIAKHRIDRDKVIRKIELRRAKSTPVPSGKINVNEINTFQSFNSTINKKKNFTLKIPKKNHDKNPHKKTVTKHIKVREREDDDSDPAFVDDETVYESHHALEYEMSVFSEPCTIASSVKPPVLYQNSRQSYKSKKPWMNSLMRNRKNIIGTTDRKEDYKHSWLKKPTEYYNDAVTSLSPSILSFKNGKQLEFQSVEDEKPYKPYERKFTLQSDVSKYFSNNDSTLGDSIDGQMQEIEKLSSQLSSAKEIIAKLLKEKEMEKNVNEKHDFR